MGFSLLMEAVLDAGIDPSRGRHLVSSFGYSTGFVLVILGRQQLFTESTLTVVLPLLTRVDITTLAKALRLWVIVLVCNLLSTWAFAALLLIPNVFPQPVVDALGTISHEAIASRDVVSTAVRAVFAGWLIAPMVWLPPSTRSGRLITVVLVTYVVSAAHLSHIVASSTEAAYAALTRDGSFADYLARFALPTLVGDVLGGMSLVALLNHAAIARKSSRALQGKLLQDQAQISRVTDTSVSVTSDQRRVGHGDRNGVRYGPAEYVGLDEDSPQSDAPRTQESEAFTLIGQCLAMDREESRPVAVVCRAG